MIRLLALLFWFPAALAAQSYPDYNATTVNDYADLLDDASEERLHKQLSKLEKETGVEMTVLTLSRQAVYAPEQSLESFATGLFNHWGIGDKNRNDGVLVLVMRTDRAMRIELGKAFGHDWDRAAAKVIDRSFLPAFKEDRYQDGIEAGVTDTINSIVTPFLSGDSAPSDDADNWVYMIVFAVFGIVGATIFKDKFVKLKKCPQCGQRQLSRSRRVKRKPSKTLTGDGEMITECSNCQYHDVSFYTINRIGSSSSSSSFGGGSSGGGGASGRW